MQKCLYEFENLKLLVFVMYLEAARTCCLRLGTGNCN